MIDSFFFRVFVVMFGKFFEAVACDKRLRLYSDASKSISLTYGGSRVETSVRNVVQPLIVPPTATNSGVVLPYLPNQLVMTPGYFSLRSCAFRLTYADEEEVSTSPYCSLDIEVYVGTKSVRDYYLFRSASACLKGETVEVSVPDIDRLFVGVGKNVFCNFYTSKVSGTQVKYSLDFRYCMTFDD